MTKEQLEGCIIGGAIGDAWGSAYENTTKKDNSKTYYWSRPRETAIKWILTDDTQLTLITLEALCQPHKLKPEVLAAAFVHNYKRGRITGTGSSTLKALRELEAGVDWRLAGREGEFAAGNGAAMRIAPFAFREEYSREDIRDFCRITHRNEEAYVGALAVVTAIRLIITQAWDGTNSLIELVVAQLPDTLVRDRLIELAGLDLACTITDAARFGTGGYVVDSVPFSIYCASQVQKIGIENMYKQIILSGGDTDTNASIAGQIAGTFLGSGRIPIVLMKQLQATSGFSWVKEVLAKVFQTNII